jgi:hypothetical protein
MLDVPVQGAQQSQRRLPCKPLGSISLHGQFFPASLTQQGQIEVEVRYLATWSHRFFGIADGMVTNFHVATAVPDANGGFDVKLPDFKMQPNLGEGELEFLLREHVTGNIIAFLRVVESGTNSPWLKVASPYASVVQFVAEIQ